MSLKKFLHQNKLNSLFGMHHTVPQGLAQLAHPVPQLSSQCSSHPLSESSQETTTERHNCQAQTTHCGAHP